MDKTARLQAIQDYLELDRKADFARYLDVKPNVLSNWFRRNTYDYEIIYTKCAFLNAEWLLTGEGEMIEGKETTPSVVNEPKSNNYLPKIVTVDSEGKDNVLFVPVPAQAGYLSGYGDPVFLQNLPSYRLPKLTNGTFRMFEVKGHSMYPTIHSGAIAIGEWCENWEEDIKDNNIYIIVSKEDGIVIKRVLNRLGKYGELFLKSDNRKEYPSYPVKPDNILEIWKLSTAFLFEFQDPADLYTKVNDLEAEILHMRALLPRKK